jgi:broad specificity phosphatase PhoE
VWENLPIERPGQLEAYLEHPWDLSFGVESLSALAARMQEVLLRLHERHVEGDVVVVSHQDPVQAARLAITGRPLETQHEDKPQHCSVITLRPGSQWHELTAWAPDQGETFPPEV